MSTMGRWAGFWFVIVACFSFVAYVGLTGPRISVTADDTTYRTQPESVATVTVAARPRIGLFIGDSYVAGTATVAQAATFGPRTCNRLGMVCYYDGQRGTGYLTSGSGPDAGRYADRLRADRRYVPDVVVVEGGRADLYAGSVTEAATSYLKAVKKQFGQAKIIVLEPFWNNAAPPAAVVTLRAEVRTAAEVAKVEYVPTTDWLTDDLMAADRITPSSAGHRALATRLTPVLRQALPAD